MPISIGAHQREGRDIGVHQINLAFPEGVAGGWSGGSRLTADGAILAIAVAADYAEQAGDVYINGTRHNNLGYMYATLDAVDGNEVLVKGLAHSSLGVRYVQATSGLNSTAGGFATDANGAQFYMIETGDVNGYQAGISRANDGSVLVNS
jgi:hypothetical protein